MSGSTLTVRHRSAAIMIGAAKMKLIGLQPSSTGMVGGKETGQHMDHYIIPGGRFEQVYDILAASTIASDFRAFCAMAVLLLLDGTIE
jgi:hypothetical protein